MISCRMLCARAQQQATAHREGGEGVAGFWPKDSRLDGLAEALEEILNLAGVRADLVEDALLLLGRGRAVRVGAAVEAIAGGGAASEGHVELGGRAARV